MKIVLLLTGRTDNGYWCDAFNDYAVRVRHYAPFEIEVIPDIKNVRNMTEAQQKKSEGQLILDGLQAGDFCVLLDERGKEYSSKEFAAFLEKKMQTVTKRLVFVVGGPYGFSDDVYARADDNLSMSRMTFSHQMIRAVFAEQLYRAMTIIRGEGYHHE
jgi:23S rRNA (pseudouridine1915-N3)-methyltransferase